MRILVVLVVTALLGCLAAPVWAFNPYEGMAPADSYIRLGAALRVARATWPDSPCLGHEQVAFVSPDFDNGKIQYPGDAPADGYAMQDGSCRVWISNETMSNYTLCTVLTHEFGHLDGQSHSTDPSDIMYPVVPNNFKPCKDAQYV